MYSRLPRTISFI